MATVATKTRYTYTGGVRQFDAIITHRWSGITFAASPERAAANLTYQYKREHGLNPASKITLVGKPKPV